MATTIAKPPGLTVFPLHADPEADCLLHRLLSAEPWRRELDWPDKFEGGILHRLDRSTSGAIWCGDSPEEVAQLRALFSTKKLRKTYVFRSAKKVQWETNTCERSIAHDRKKKRKMVVQRGPSTPHRGKWYPAKTSFRHLHGDLWEATIRTGVTHQIRIHAAFLGIPILGDRLYGGGATPTDAPPGVSFFLHHRGLTGPGGLQTSPVPPPAWAPTLR